MRSRPFRTRLRRELGRTRGNRRYAAAGIAGALAVLAIGCGSRAGSESLALGLSLPLVDSWQAPGESFAVAVTSSGPGEVPAGGQLVVIDAGTGSERGRVDVGGAPHVAIDDAGQRLYVAFEEGSGEAIIASIDLQSGRILASSGVPPVWGSPGGLVGPSLFVAEEEDVLVLGHFVRAKDARNGVERNEFGVSLLDIGSLRIIDAYTPQECPDGRISDGPQGGLIAIACPESASVVLVPFSASGFHTDKSRSVPLQGIAAMGALETAAARNSEKTQWSLLPIELYHDWALRGDGLAYVGRRAIADAGKPVAAEVRLVDYTTGEVVARSEGLPFLRSFELDERAQQLWAVQEGRSELLILNGDQLDRSATYNIFTEHPIQYVVLNPGSTTSN